MVRCGACHGPVRKGIRVGARLDCPMFGRDAAEAISEHEFGIRGKLRPRTDVVHGRAGVK